MSICLIATLAALATTGEGLRAQSQSLVKAYEEFRDQFGINRPGTDALSYDARVALFEQRREFVRKHNSMPGRSWTAAVNQFADYTDEEFQSLLGHRPDRRSRAAEPGSSLLEMMPAEEIAQSVDWSQTLQQSRSAKNQGGCGSCWAVAAAGAIEMHAEKVLGSATEVSYEELVDCVENKRECGGKGGCAGATAELAFDYIQHRGIAAKSDYKGYQSGGKEGQCKTPSHGAVLKSTGFTRLPTNKLQPLLHALSTQGPVVISADASGWSAYSSGVFDGCGKDAVVNHAILAVGYGTDDSLKKDYWLIRNSWGPTWGEGGYVRLLRANDDKYCGVDRSPLDGVGCKGGPATLPVCGMCGMLSDSSFPVGLTMTANNQTSSPSI
jgi:cathepsin L